MSNCEKIFVVMRMHQEIGLSSGICSAVCCFRKRGAAEAYSERLAKEMNFSEEDCCPRTGGWHNEKNDVWIEEAELR